MFTRPIKVMLTCLMYVNDILLFSNKASLESMVADQRNANERAPRENASSALRPGTAAHYFFLTVMGAWERGRGEIGTTGIVELLPPILLVPTC